jgi:hypothetical protein
MAIEVGDVVVDEEGNATGSGLSFELFTDILAEIGEDAAKAVAAKVGPFCEGTALAISRYVSSGDLPYLAQMGPPQFASLTQHCVAEVRGTTLPASGSYTCLDIDGAGYLSRIFMTIAGTADSLIRGSRLQVYVDGEVTPSIDVQFQDLCCFRGAGSASYPADVVTTKFSALRANSTTLGPSYHFNLVAPFSTHLKVAIVNGGSTAGTLGGHIDYELGASLNWGPYGKLHCYSLPGDALTQQTLATLLDVTLENGGLLAGIYLFADGGDTLPAYLEGRVRFYLDGSETPVDYDSTEDYFGSGWYFAAGAKTNEQTGCTYLSGNNVGMYRWHDRDPIQFASRLQIVWQVGQDWPVPTEHAVTLNGVIWYYEAAAGGTVSPTLVKGDTGTPGITGATGAAGSNARDPIGQHDTTNSPIVLYQGADNTDSSGNARHLTTLDAGIPCLPIGRGSSAVKALTFLGTTALSAVRVTRTSQLDVNGDLTIAFMLRLNSVGAMYTILDYSAPARNSVSTQSLYTLLLTSTGRFRFQWQYGGSNTQTNDFSTGGLAWVGEIQHFAVVRSGTAPNISVKLYKNGALACTVSSIAHAPDGSSFAQYLQIGNFVGGDATYWLRNAQISSLGIYGAALSDAQILAMAQRCLEGV